MEETNLRGWNFDSTGIDNSVATHGGVVAYRAGVMQPLQVCTPMFISWFHKLHWLSGPCGLTSSVDKHWGWKEYKSSCPRVRLFFISSLPFPLALSLSLRVKFYFHSLFQLSFLIVQGRDINVLNSILAFLLELLLSSQSEIAPQSIQLIYPHHFPFHMRVRELNFHFY